MTNNAQSDAPSKEKEHVIIKALLNTKDLLHLSGTEIEEITGISESKLSRIKNHEAQINDKKKYQLAVLLIRLYRSLDSITNNDGTSSEWMRNTNTALNGIPIELTKTPQGLIDVINYLDSRRAII